jgi:hypothetical protein
LIGSTRLAALEPFESRITTIRKHVAIIVIMIQELQRRW